MQVDDTIAAIATPLGEGGLAVLRISGGEALSVADKCFRIAGQAPNPLSAAATHTIVFGHVTHPITGEKIDEALVAVMRAPRTFTRENVVELTCHGGVLAAKLVLDAVLQSGARLAEPGEFTRRAFLNGRIDLAQAEAVADLIHARTEMSLRAANQQLEGHLSARVNALRDMLMTVLAHVEAHIDFPDEDISPDTREQLDLRMKEAIATMDSLLATATEGQVLRQGIRGAIIGRPNAGKSSLLNRLLGHDRAIVSPVPGTTRDTIEETANIRGLPVIFIDTAGLRDAGDEIEMEGIRRSRKSLERAEFVIHLMDGSQPLTGAEQMYLEEFKGKKRILVINKCDLPEKLIMRPDGSEQVVRISCVTGQGVEELKNAIKALVWSGEIRAEMLEVMINSRHQDALRRGRQSAERARVALNSGTSVDLVAIDLKMSVDAVGEIVGKTTTEDLLDAIFSQFCIGK
jgi:tRNA modification GTPase